MSRLRRKLLFDLEDSTYATSVFYAPLTKDPFDVHGFRPVECNSRTFDSNGMYCNGSDVCFYNDYTLLSQLSENLRRGNTDFTVTCTLIPQSVGRNQYVFDLAHSPLNSHFLSIFIYYAQHNRFSITLHYPGGGTPKYDSELNYSGSVVYGNKYNFTIVFRDGYAYAYINDLQVNPFEVYENRTTSITAVDIGGQSKSHILDSLDRQFKGYIKDFAIWNYAINDSLVQKLQQR